MANNYTQQTSSPPSSSSAGQDIVTNQLGAAYPYAPLPENLLDEESSFAGEEEPAYPGIIGCAKTSGYGFQYLVPETKQEFVRYCHRSLEGAAVLIANGMGNIAVISQGEGATGWVVLILGFVEILLAFADIAVHIVKRAGTSFTYEVALLRRALQSVAAIIICLVFSWSWDFDETQTLCTRDSTYGMAHQGQEASVQTLYQSCLRSTPPGAFVNYLLIAVLKLDIYFHFLCSGLFFWMQMLSLNVIPSTTNLEVQWQMSPEDRTVRIVLAVIGVCFCNLLALAKHQDAQRGFEASLTLHHLMRANKRRLEAVDRLMSTMAPPTALGRLLEGRKVFDHAPMATVLFSDMVHFTYWSSDRTPTEVVSMLSVLVRSFDMLAAEMAVSKVKTIGDCYWAVTGIPDHVERHAEVMINFALAMLDLVRKEAKSHKEWDYPAPKSQALGIQTIAGRRPIQFRTGIHSGPVQAGIFGTQQISYEIFGETSVNANRVEANGVADRIVVTARSKYLAEFGDDDLPYTFTALRPQAYNNNSAVVIDTTSSMAVSGERQQPEATDDQDVCDTLFLISDVGSSRRNTYEGRGGRGRSLALQSVEGSSVHSVSQRSGGRSIIYNDVNTSIITRSSAGMTNQDDAKAKAQRKKYVETHLLEGDAITQLSDEGQLELTRRFSQRKNCLSDAFAEDEEGFKEFTLSREVSLRMKSLFISFGILTVVFGLILLDASGDLGPLFMLLFLLGFLLMGASTLLSCRAVRKRQSGGVIKSGHHHRISVWEDYAGPFLAYTAVYAVLLAGIVGPPSVVTNDTFYVLILMFAVLAFPNSHIPPSALCLGGLIINVLAFVNTVVKGHFFRTRLMLSLVGCLGTSALVLIQGAKARVEFIEDKVARHFAQQQAIAVRAQDALLASMLPDFVIKPLTAWLASDFDPAKTVVMNFDEMCVGFIRMSGGAAVKSTLEPLSPRSLDASCEWLFAGHKSIDEVLRNTKTIDKVKTVGDLVIVAGSFRGHSSAVAAAAMLSVVVKIHSSFEGTNAVTIGLHAGPVMAIVLGFSRLAFDIFGDAVNTASRVMTAPNSKHTITASMDYLKLLPAAPFTLKHPNIAGSQPPTQAAWAGETVDYGPVRELAAKGKADLCVQEIIHTQ